jgi:hypothetical protein
MTMDFEITGKRINASRSTIREAAEAAAWATVAAGVVVIGVLVAILQRDLAEIRSLLENARF